MKNTTLTSQLRQRITIEEPTETPDGAGGYTTSWSTLTSIWAHIEPLSRSSGNERFVEGQLQDRTRWRIAIRYRDDITPKMRAVYGSRLFNIRAVIDPDGMQRELVLIAEEGEAV